MSRPANTSMDRLRHGRRALWLVALPAAAAWALVPLGASPVQRGTAPDAAPSALPAVQMPEPLNLAAFHAPLWVRPPAPLAEAETPSPPPPPPVSLPPLRLQLVAIVRESGEEHLYSALLYDPDADRLLVVRQGQSLGNEAGIEGRVVELVTPQAVWITGQDGRRALALRPDAPPAGADGGAR